MDLSNSEINKIGDVIRQGRNTVGYETAVSVLNEWREAHGGIMGVYYDKCKKMTKDIDAKNILVAQRLKRLPTMIDKLNRFKDMRLSSMQDVAGVRIIVEDMRQLRSVESRLRRWKKLHREPKDYIAHPKDNGYRSKHFIFKEGDMFVEIQLRTRLQHLWATAVETTDVFRGTSMKTNTDGTYWNDFFCLASSAFAIMEGEATVPGYDGIGMIEVCRRLNSTMVKHKIDSKIAGFAFSDLAVDNEKVRGSYYVLISLDFANKKVGIRGYKEPEYDLAYADYLALERVSKRNDQVVLVSVNKVRKIREAYPNFFMDLGSFVGVITYILDKNKKEGYNSKI